MEQVRNIPIEVEPVGIVISRGKQVDPAPRFAAYVWSEVPEQPLDSAAARRAA